MLKIVDEVTTQDKCTNLILKGPFVLCFFIINSFITFIYLFVLKFLTIHLLFIHMLLFFAVYNIF